MELILLIVKIILTIFLVLLSLLILALVLILLVPVRYEVSGSIGELPEMQFHGNLSYFMSVVRVKVSYEKGQFMSKLFLFGMEKNARKEHVKEVVEEAEETLETEAEETESTTESVEAEGLHEDEQRIKKQTDKTKTETRRVKAGEEETQKSFAATVAVIKQWLAEERYKSVLRKILSELQYLWKHFKFRKIAADVTFAAGDPAVTGQVLGLLCMVPVLYRYQLQVTPDFEAENPYVKGVFQAVGKVRLIHVTITFLRLFFDKEVRFVLKQLTEGGNGDRK